MLKKEQVEEDLPDLFSSFLGLGIPELSEQLDKKRLPRSQYTAFYLI